MVKKEKDREKDRKKIGVSEKDRGQLRTLDKCTMYGVDPMRRQFAIAKPLDTNGNFVPGIVHDKQKYDGKTRYVDSMDPNEPGYLASHGAGDADFQHIVMIDDPSVPAHQLDDKVATVEFIFDDYLICRGEVRYHVHWEYTAPVGGRGKVHGLGGSSKDGLPSDLQGDTWKSNDGTNVKSRVFGG
jgi:hypothetical protein